MKCMEMYGSGASIIGIVAIVAHQPMEPQGLIEKVQHLAFIGADHGRAMRMACVPRHDPMVVRRNAILILDFAVFECR